MSEPYTQIVIAVFAGIFGTIGCGLVGKIIWDWLKNNRRNNPVPHAGNGFLTLSEIQGHCNKQQEVCTKLMKAEFKVIKTEIQGRLDKGDKQFENIDTRLGGIEDAIKEIAENGRNDDDET